MSTKELLALTFYHPLTANSGRSSERERERGKNKTNECRQYTTFFFNPAGVVSTLLFSSSFVIARESRPTTTITQNYLARGTLWPSAVRQYEMK